MFPGTRVTDVPISSSKGQSSRIPDVKNVKQMMHIHLDVFTYGWRLSFRSVRRIGRLKRRLQDRSLTIVRPNLLSAAEQRAG